MHLSNREILDNFLIMMTKTDRSYSDAFLKALYVHDDAINSYLKNSGQSQIYHLSHVQTLSGRQDRSPSDIADFQSADGNDDDQSDYQSVDGNDTNGNDGSDSRGSENPPAIGKISDEIKKDSRYEFIQKMYTDSRNTCIPEGTSCVVDNKGDYESCQTVQEKIKGITNDDEIIPALIELFKEHMKECYYTDQTDVEKKCKDQIRAYVCLFDKLASNLKVKIQKPTEDKIESYFNEEDWSYGFFIDMLGEVIKKLNNANEAKNKLEEVKSIMDNALDGWDVDIAAEKAKAKNKKNYGKKEILMSILPVGLDETQLESLETLYAGSSEEVGANERSFARLVKRIIEKIKEKQETEELNQILDDILNDLKNKDWIPEKERKSTTPTIALDFADEQIIRELLESISKEISNKKLLKEEEVVDVDAFIEEYMQDYHPEVTISDDNFIVDKIRDINFVDINTETLQKLIDDIVKFTENNVSDLYVFLKEYKILGLEINDQSIILNNKVYTPDEFLYAKITLEIRSRDINNDTIKDETTSYSMSRYVMLTLAHDIKMLKKFLEKKKLSFVREPKIDIKNANNAIIEVDNTYGVEIGDKKYVFKNEENTEAEMYNLYIDGVFAANQDNDIIGTISFKDKNIIINTSEDLPKIPYSYTFSDGVFNLQRNDYKITIREENYYFSEHDKSTAGDKDHYYLYNEGATEILGEIWFNEEKCTISWAPDGEKKKIERVYSYRKNGKTYELEEINSRGDDAQNDSYMPEDFPVVNEYYIFLGSDKNDKQNHSEIFNEFSTLPNEQLEKCNKDGKGVRPETFWTLGDSDISLFVKREKDFVAWAYGHILKQGNIVTITNTTTTRSTESREKSKEEPFLKKRFKNINLSFYVGEYKINLNKVNTTLYLDGVCNTFSEYLYPDKTGYKLKDILKAMKEKCNADLILVGASEAHWSKGSNGDDTNISFYIKKGMIPVTLEANNIQGETDQQKKKFLNQIEPLLSNKKVGKEQLFAYILPDDVGTEDTIDASIGRFRSVFEEKEEEPAEEISDEEIVTERNKKKKKRILIAPPPHRTTRSQSSTADKLPRPRRLLPPGV